VKAADDAVQSAAAVFKANGGFDHQLRMRAADEDQDQPLLPTPPGSPSRRLTRAAPASMPYMTLRRGGVLKPCSQGEGSNACDVCAEAGAGNSARLAALKHASLWLGRRPLELIHSELSVVDAGYHSCHEDGEEDEVA
jgi:hypothetical protein